MVFLFQAIAVKEVVIKITGPGYTGQIPKEKCNLKDLKKELKERFNEKNIALAQKKVDSCLTIGACVLTNEDDFKKLYDEAKKLQEKRESQKKGIVPVKDISYFESTKKIYKVEDVEVTKPKR